MDHEKKAVEHFTITQYVYIGLSVIYLLFGANSNSKLLKLILKCAPVGTLIGLIAVTVFQAGRAGPLVGGILRDYIPHLFWGLLFSILGDLYLVFDSLLPLGIASFAVAQGTYVVLFDGTLFLENVMDYNLTQQQIVTAVAIGLVSMLVYGYIFPKFTWFLAVAALVYSMLISVMLWCAFVRAQETPTTPNVTAAIGACMFYMSDLVLSLKIWPFKESSLSKPMGVFVMVTYYGAQLLIVRSIFVQS